MYKRWEAVKFDLFEDVCALPKPHDFCSRENIERFFDRLIVLCNEGDPLNLKLCIDEVLGTFENKAVPYCNLWCELDIHQNLCNIIATCGNPLLILSILELLDRLSRSAPAYGHDLARIGFHAQLFEIFCKTEVPDLRSRALMCERNLVELSLENRNEMMEKWDLSSLIRCENVTYNVLQLLYSISKYPMDQSHFADLARVATILAQSITHHDEKLLQIFCMFLFNMSKSSWFCDFFSTPPICCILDSGLFGTQNPDIICRVLYIEEKIYRNRSLTDVRIVERVVQLLESYRVSSSASQTKRDRVVILLGWFMELILSAFPETVDTALQPRLGLTLLRHCLVAPVVVKEYLFDVLFRYACAWPEYIPLLIDNGLLSCISDLMDSTRPEPIEYIVMLLDCILGNRPEFIERLNELGIVSQMEERAETDNTCAAFLGIWYAIVD